MARLLVKSVLEPVALCVVEDHANLLVLLLISDEAEKFIVISSEVDA